MQFRIGAQTCRDEAGLTGVARGLLDPQTARNLAPFEKLSWKDKTQNFFLESSAPVELWAPESSRTFDPAIQFFSWGSGKWHSGDAACPTKKSTIVVSVEGLNRKAFEEAGR
jgi:hypothetical protein